MSLERRSVANLEASNGQLRGYAAVFDKDSQDLGGFIERIRVGAFANSLRTRPHVLALSGHDTNQVLGNTASGTLTLKEDAKGLHYTIDLPDTSAARDLAVLVARGDVRGASFGFRTVRDGWDYDSTPMRRELIEVELYEVSITALPAYIDSSVAQRHLTQIRCPARTHLTRWLTISQL